MKLGTLLGRKALILLLMLALSAAACGGDDSADEATDDDSDVVAAGDDPDAPSADSGDDADTSESPSDSGATGGTLRIGTLVDAQTFDTAGIGLGHFFQYWLPVYDTLLTLAPDGSLEPNLATEWSYNDDNTVLTLSLQDGVTFTDGEAFNAEAVKANIEYFRDSGGRFSVIAADVADVVVVEDLTVELQLSQPRASSRSTRSLLPSWPTSASRSSTSRSRRTPSSTGSWPGTSRCTS